LGTIALAGGRHAEAHEEASAVLAREARNVEALVLLAGGALAPAEVDTAIRRLQDARGEAGSSVKLLLALGALHLRQDDPGAAERAFREAVAREPKLIEARLALGEFHLGAKELAPEDASVSDTLGWILYQRGIYHRALALFKESAAGLPESPDVQYRLGC
ncbi:MAG: tetratricopeptide repeat protein, partial [Candidatus Rokubacteria bacterium]|nr:tetratricopeptide repeat protein [Candidatus Rokubacteria bacterium]